MMMMSWYYRAVSLRGHAGFIIPRSCLQVPPRRRGQIVSLPLVMKYLTKDVSGLGFFLKIYFSDLIHSYIRV